MSRMSKKLILISFADKRYSNAMNQLLETTNKFPFSERNLLNEDDLPKNYLKTLRYKLHRRGFGYWKWKSYLVKKQIETMQNDDILIYSDAGVYWNNNGIDRFLEYIELLDKSDKFILTFQQPYLEKDYSKGDILKYTNTYNNEKITMSLQLWGGCFIIKKNEKSIEFIDKWYDLCHNHYDLITDKQSKAINLPGFVEHRHDQSAFSLLVKQYQHIEISYKEVQALDRNWEILDSFPIQGRRCNKKLQSTKAKFIRKLTIPYKLLIGQYLIYFEQFHFTNKPIW